MFQSPRREDVSKYDGLACDKSSPQLSTPQTSQPLPPSASSSDTTSPALSLFSKAHTAKSGSNASSIASSPALRDSFEIFTSSKRLLTDVKEEPLEREDADMTDVSSYHSGMSHFMQLLPCHLRPYVRQRRKIGTRNVTTGPVNHAFSFGSPLQLQRMRYCRH